MTERKRVTHETRKGGSQVVEPPKGKQSQPPKDPGNASTTEDTNHA